jgi:hypothetical protein
MYDPVCDMLFDSTLSDEEVGYLFDDLDPPCGHGSYCGVLFCEYEVAPRTPLALNLDWRPSPASKMTLCRSYTDDQARRVLLLKVNGLTYRAIGEKVK